MPSSGDLVTVENNKPQLQIEDLQVGHAYKSTQELYFVFDQSVVVLGKVIFMVVKEISLVEDDLVVLSILGPSAIGKLSVVRGHLTIRFEEI